MGRDHHLDVNRAVKNFLVCFESLSCLPFIGDDEIVRLYGEQVETVLAELERYNQQENLCRNCEYRCCQLVKCEFYNLALSICPAHHFRPLLCRMHYCDKFTPVYPLAVKELGDIFLESLLAAERINIEKAKLFDCPPLSKLVPELTKSVSNFIKTTGEGRLDEDTILKLINDEIIKLKAGGC